MDTLRQAYKSFLLRPDLWFFYAFLFSSPFSVRKIFYSLQINGEFNEYSNISLYASDVFIILTFIAYAFVLYNKFNIVSSFNFDFNLSLKNCSTWNNLKNAILDITNRISQVIHRDNVMLLLILGCISILSTIWANYEAFAIYRSLKIFEFTFIAYYIMKNVPRGTFFIKILLITIFLGLLNSVLGIAQFIQQKSIGLTWLKESIISPESINVAKVIFNNTVYIRAYGFFPHPNVFAGFLVLSIIFTYILYKISIKKINVPRGTFIKNNSVLMFHVEHFFQNKKNFFIILSIQLLALTLTFSKSAIIALIIASIYVYFLATINPFGRLWSYIQTYLNRIILILAILIVSLYITKPDLNSLILRSVSDRIHFLNVSRGTIIENPVLGIGSGQYVVNLIDKSTNNFWQLAPVHNVYMLILSEIGIVSLTLFIYIIYRLVFTRRIVPRGTIPDKQYFIFIKSILLGLSIIMLFDHYLWDIQQGQIILFLIIGLLL